VGPDEDIELLDCLETVGGSLTIDARREGSAVLAPNLRSVGGSLEVHPSPQERLDVTCSFGSLESIGSRLHIDGAAAGVLDFSRVTSFTYVGIYHSDITRVILPDEGAFRISQFIVSGNAELVEVGGFQNVDLSGTLSLWVEDNPLLSTCWANDFATRIAATGAVAAPTIRDNAADCDPP
jgi:hypothetical protein